MMDRLLDTSPLPRSDADDQWTSFQYSCFTSQASQVNTNRNSTTHTPELAPLDLGRLADVVEEVHRIAHEASYSSRLMPARSERLEMIEHLLG